MRTRRSSPWRWTIIPTYPARPATGSARPSDLQVRGDGLRRVHVRTGLRHEDRTAVVLQLADALPDVRERAVRQPLRRLSEVDPRIPPPAELLDRRDIDHAIVQVGVERRHVPREETPVGGD